MTMRYEVFGCGLPAPPEEYAKDYFDRFVGVGNYPNSGNLSFMRLSDLGKALQLLSLHHLGYSVGKPREVLDRGFDVAVDYFCGDWWIGDETSARCLDKTRKDFEPEWIAAFADALLLGLLSERWDELAKICAWVEADMPPEYTGTKFEDELVHVYRSIAASLRTEPMPGLDQVEASISKCRRKRPKLLFQAWDSARQGNQEAFETAFLKSLQHFAKGFCPQTSLTMDDYCSPILWIAPHHSVVALAARRMGMKLPELTPKQEVWIITPESLGLQEP